MVYDQNYHNCSTLYDLGLRHTNRDVVAPAIILRSSIMNALSCDTNSEKEAIQVMLE
jgi:hypothetical protein